MVIFRSQANVLCLSTAAGDIHHKCSSHSYADISKTTKEEGPEVDPAAMEEEPAAIEAEPATMEADPALVLVKDPPPSEEPLMPPMSPSYMSDTSDTFANSYQALSQVCLKN